MPFGRDPGTWRPDVLQIIGTATPPNVKFPGQQG
jgi:hypothetical protein